MHVCRASSRTVLAGGIKGSSCCHTPSSSRVIRGQEGRGVNGSTGLIPGVGKAASDCVYTSSFDSESPASN